MSTKQSIALSFGAAACALIMSPLFAAANPAAGVYTAPLNNYGQPDLEGTWTNATLTVLERPKEYGTRKGLTAEEVAKIEGSSAQLFAADNAPRDPKVKTTDLPHECDAWVQRRGILRLQRRVDRPGHYGDAGKRRAAQFLYY